MRDPDALKSVLNRQSLSFDLRKSLSRDSKSMRHEGAVGTTTPRPLPRPFNRFYALRGASPMASQ